MSNFHQYIIRLIHWKPEEACEAIRTMEKSGYRIISDKFDQATFRELRSRQADAIIIDLSRLPSYGREIALHLRINSVTRFIPLVFVEGNPEKVDMIREILPDAVYTNWEKLPDILPAILAHPPTEPVVPESVFAAYRKKTLIQKLGIKPEMCILLIDSPCGFKDSLGKLPAGVTFHNNLNSPNDLIVWFADSLKTFQEKIPLIKSLIGPGGIWIAWRKGSSGKTAGLNQNLVRQTGLQNSLVDYKICSIDTTWSALKFQIRK